MDTTGPPAAILGYLRGKSVGYFAKADELAAAIEGWLEYIPQTFPHYTNHTIRHSEEILRQVSSLLFVDEDPAQPVVPLSSRVPGRGVSNRSTG